VAIRQPTLRLGRQLRVTVGTEADQATRTLTDAWVRAWDVLSGSLTDAVLDVLAITKDGQWPPQWELRRVARLESALREAQEALAQLGQRTGVVVTDAAGNAIAATADVEPRLIASQLPAGERVEATKTFAAGIHPQTLDVMMARTTGQIHSAIWDLGSQATEAIRRELIRGIAIGSSPRETARQMVARCEGEFNGGLSRALNIARTETLDAYRVTSQYAHMANKDVLAGWIWTCTLSRRTCPACLSKNGTQYPLDTPGPLDHQSGRCARMPKTKTWRELGINLDEPPDSFPDARKWFSNQSEVDQLAIMGPHRLQLLQSGDVSWDDLATRRAAPAGWRASYAPTSVRDLAQEARAA
jgi:hypothetical protein